MNSPFISSMLTTMGETIQATQKGLSELQVAAKTQCTNGSKSNFIEELEMAKQALQFALRDMQRAKELLSIMQWNGE